MKTYTLISRNCTVAYVSVSVAYTIDWPCHNSSLPLKLLVWIFGRIHFLFFLPPIAQIELSREFPLFWSKRNHSDEVTLRISQTIHFARFFQLFWSLRFDPCLTFKIDASYIICVWMYESKRHKENRETGTVNVFVNEIQSFQNSNWSQLPNIHMGFHSIDSVVTSWVQQPAVQLCSIRGFYCTAYFGLVTQHHFNIFIQWRFTNAN